jgi:surfeit locus 1 family protein
LTVLLSLSAWQMQRAETKTQILSRLTQWQQKDAVSAAQLLNFPAAGVDGLQVKFEGRWIAPIVWLLDNQTYNGRIGYDVLVPVALSEESKNSPNTILVNLGWVAAPELRAQLPRVKIPSHIEVSGLLRTEFKGLLLGNNLENNQHWPMRIQQIDIQLLAPFLQSTLYQGVVYQQHNSPFTLHYHPVVMSPERHKAYALQWALLAVAFVMVVVVATAHRQTNKTSNNDVDNLANKENKEKDNEQ